MSLQQFKQTLQDYGKLVGLVDIQYDDQRGTCLEFASDIELCLHWNEQAHTLYASIFCGFPSDKNKSQLYEQLLGANYFWSGTGGGTLAYKSDMNAIFLIDAWGENVIQSPEILSRHIDQIVHAAEKWQKTIEVGVGDAPSKNHQYARNTRHIRGLGAQ